MGPGPQSLVLISMSQIKTEEINWISVKSRRIPQNQKCSFRDESTRNLHVSTSTHSYSEIQLQKHVDANVYQRGLTLLELLMDYLTPKIKTQ